MDSASQDHAPTPQGTVWLISAPSGAGKTSLVKALLAAMPQLCLSISHTTRPRRGQEQDGQNYHFTSKAAFERMIAEEAFLEYAQVFGNYYGTGAAWVAQQTRSGRDVMLEIDWQGAAQVRSRLPSARSVFILPPSMDELLRRLRHRGEDDEATIERRYQSAKEEISHATDFDYVIVNDEFNEAQAALTGIIAGDPDLRQKHRVSAQEQAVQALLDHTRSGTP